jgi:hypothetical protein
MSHGRQATPSRFGKRPLSKMESPIN